MTEMDFSMASSRNSAKSCDFSTIFLTLTNSVATAERSVSNMKLIKSNLRASMSQDRLSSLSLISIENETVERIDFD